MDLLLDILQGAGLAAAAGIRPFLPALLAGALANADIGLDFDATGFAYLEAAGWLLAVLLALIAVAVLQRRGADEAGPLGAALTGIGIGLGALLFAGSLDDRQDVWWYGLLLGGGCAALAGAATRALLLRTSARLDGEARAALPLYADATALVLAGLAVLIPPVSLLALAFLAFLLRRVRRQEGEKYAGLRILR